jgi:hypothetical protein
MVMAECTAHDARAATKKRSFWIRVNSGRSPASDPGNTVRGRGDYLSMPSDFFFIMSSSLPMVPFFAMSPCFIVLSFCHPVMFHRRLFLHHGAVILLFHSVLAHRVGGMGVSHPKGTEGGEGEDHLFHGGFLAR